MILASGSRAQFPEQPFLFNISNYYIRYLSHSQINLSSSAQGGFSQHGEIISQIQVSSRLQLSTRRLLSASYFVTQVYSAAELLEPMCIIRKRGNASQQMHWQWQNTHRGARTHDHKVKSLALRRLS
jgi:hypothetical protein